MNHSLNNTISHTQICHRASQCVTMIKTPCATRTTEVINNCLKDSLLLQSRWQCFIHGNIDCLCRHGVQNAFFSLTKLWEGSSVTGSSPHKGQAMPSVYILFAVILDKLLNKQPGWIWILIELIEYLFSPPIFFSNKLDNVSCVGNTKTVASQCSKQLCRRRPGAEGIKLGLNMGSLSKTKARKHPHIIVWSTFPMNRTRAFRPLKSLKYILIHHPCSSPSPLMLTHGGRVTHICVITLVHHWFRWWLVAL